MPSGESSGESEAQETKSLLLACNLTGALNVELYAPSGSKHDVQQIRLTDDLLSEGSPMLNPVKHKIFLSHSGAQKDFVEQLCVDLEARGYVFPFFDQRCSSLPKGKDFVPLITVAAQQCHVAVIVLSEEFLSSKWPMIELAEFHVAQQAAKNVGSRQLNMLPLFFKLQIKDLDDEIIKDRWMPIWRKHEENEAVKRIDVRKWHEAVTALKATNGLIFQESEVQYRKIVVQSIMKLSPPDLLNGSSRSVVGYDRLCETISNQFVEDNITGAQVLGLYGLGGIGKTTLAGALCDYFYNGFGNRTCHVELGGASKILKRQKMVLGRLCEFEKDVLDRITNVDQGWTLMQDSMKRKPVFLVIDNVTNDVNVRDEAIAYLKVGFHSQSKIVITSRGKEIVKDLLPHQKACVPMPHLNEEEARVIFMNKADPWRNMSLLVDEESSILQKCIQHCWFRSDEAISDQELGSYHPMALMALGDFFYRMSKNHMLPWKEYLKENNEVLKHVWKSSNIFTILGLQFGTFQPSEQLLFLDIALYGEGWQYATFFELYFNDMVDWLSEMHDETRAVVEIKLWDLKRSGMVDWGHYDRRTGETFIRVPDLYREFVEWYVAEEGTLKNVWCAYQSGKTDPSVPKRLKRPIPSKCWETMVRLRMFDLTYTKLVPCEKFQEVCNLVLLQIHSCNNLTTLDLHGLNCLRHLELVELPKLVTVKFTKDSHTPSKDVGIYKSLLCVVLKRMDSLTCIPDLRLCTSLQWFFICWCFKWTSFEEMETCSKLKMLWLQGLIPNHLNNLPNFRSLSSLENLWIATGHQQDEVEVLDLDSLKYCKHLDMLGVICPGVKSLPGLAQLTHLRRIYLYTVGLNKIPSLSRMCLLGEKWQDFREGRCSSNWILVDNYPLREYPSAQAMLGTNNDDSREEGPSSLYKCLGGF